MANKVKTKRTRELRRRRRVRAKVSGTATTPRMTVYRSLKGIYVQIVDDVNQVTLIGLSNKSKEMADKIDAKDTKTDKAKKLGMVIAEMALEKGIKQVVFDRNRFLYHGRVKAIADGAREKGLKI